MNTPLQCKCLCVYASIRLRLATWHAADSHLPITIRIKQTKTNNWLRLQPNDKWFEWTEYVAQVVAVIVVVGRSLAQTFLRGMQNISIFVIFVRHCASKMQTKRLLHRINSYVFGPLVQSSVHCFILVRYDTITGGLMLTTARINFRPANTIDFNVRGLFVRCAVHNACLKWNFAFYWSFTIIAGIECKLRAEHLSRDACMSERTNKRVVKSIQGAFFAYSVAKTIEEENQQQHARAQNQSQNKTRRSNNETTLDAKKK